MAILTRACPHFKNGDKNEINCRQTRRIAQLISGYYPAIWQNLAIFSSFRCLSIELRKRPKVALLHNFEDMFNCA